MDTDTEAEMEQWKDFTQRATRCVEDRLRADGQEEWLATWRRRQWRYAGHLVRDNADKWSHQVLEWSPTTASRTGTYRTQARPRKRWHDELNSFHKALAFNGCWQATAMKKEIWADVEDQYVEWCGHLV